MNFNIQNVTEDLDEKIKHKIDNKTKPLGSLGKLENLAFKICKIQNTLSPKLTNPTVVVFAGDHGAAKEGISPFPQEVTYQMVLNFLNSGAAINVFAKENGMEIKVVDTGVNFDFENFSDPINCKVAYGTKSYINQPAMTEEECYKAIKNGANIVEEINNKGCNIIAFGEMGIGNTSSASIILSKVCDVSIEEATGPGAGHNLEGLRKKTELLKKAINTNNCSEDPIDILKTFGGFEIASTVGAMLKAAELKMIILVDGFIITSALLIAQAINKNILDYTVYSHRSDEHGHQKMLQFLNAEPILDLHLRLGEGTGATLAYPLIKSAVAFINKMASFEEAEVSNKN